MKSLFVALFLVWGISVSASEKKAIENVSLNDIITETQRQPEFPGDSHLGIVWWLPYEYWEVSLVGATDLPKSIKDNMLSTLKNYMIVSVVQSDVSMMGAFDFYSKEEVQKFITLHYEDSNGKKTYLNPEETIPVDLEILLGQMAPILKAAMGNMGSNFHFLIYKDKQSNGQRLVDPYKKGVLKARLSNRKGEFAETEFESPLNALYLPRVCPNGKAAHISWNYCPWSGQKPR